MPIPACLSKGGFHHPNSLDWVFSSTTHSVWLFAKD